MCTAILLSGGIGSRMKQSVPKQYMLLAGKPVIMHTLERLGHIEGLEKIVVVCAQEYQAYIRSMLGQYGIDKPVVFAQPGKTRQDSVKAGLDCVDTETVLIHEAVRPFVRAEDFSRILHCEEENVILGVPEHYTVAKGHGTVSEFLDRSELVIVQAPQKFSANVLKTAREMAEKEGRQFTEDASLVLFYNKDLKIKILEGMDYNIKLTTPTDILVADSIYREYFQK